MDSLPTKLSGKALYSLDVHLFLLFLSRHLNHIFQLFSSLIVVMWLNSSQCNMNRWLTKTFRHNMAEPLGAKTDGQTVFWIFLWRCFRNKFIFSSIWIKQIALHNVVGFINQLKVWLEQKGDILWAEENSAIEGLWICTMATAPLRVFSLLATQPADFRFDSLHYCVSKFLKTNPLINKYICICIHIYIYIYSCSLKEEMATQLEEELVTQTSILAWRSLMNRGA